MPITDTYHIWTTQMSMWRLVKEYEIAFIDITVKSGILSFAPTWDNLRAYKAGLVSKEEYTRRYYEKVITSSDYNVGDWQRLVQNKRMAFACYCRSGDYCHRHLFSPLAITYLQNLGHQVVFHGELQSNTVV